MATETEKNTATTEALGTVQDMERAVEAILFAAGYPVKYEKLSEVIGLPLRDIKNLVAHMADGYGERGIQLLLFPDACQLCTKEIFAPYIREALGIKRGGNLSASSLEVLAVVAYNQPVTRSFVDTVRGVDSSYAVTSLLDKGMIEACGRLEAPGRPMLYRTTEKFLRVFGLSSLADLPETEALQTADAAQNGAAIVADRAEQLSIKPEDNTDASDDAPATEEDNA
jgi:segregation and condensation protein B